MTKERPGEREAFEKWAERGYHLGRDHVDDDLYQSGSTQSVWDAWQARATLSARGGTEGPVAWGVRMGKGRHNPEGRVWLAIGDTKGAADAVGNPLLHDPEPEPLYAAPTRARQDALEEALRFYAEPFNYERGVVVEDTMGGNVPVDCPDPEAHIRAQFGPEVAAMSGDARPVLPHDCPGNEDGPTKKWSGDTQVRPWGLTPVLKDGGERARAALSPADGGGRG